MRDEDLYYGVSKRPILRPFLRSPIFAMGVHWVFQGMLYMDRTERLFKLGLDLILTALLWILLSPLLGLSWAWALLVAFLLAHTLNFLFNGQMWVVLKHFHLVRNSRSEFEDYLSQLAQRIQAEPSIERAAAYGSLVRGEWHESSDLDLRLVRKPGLRNGLRACWFAMRERTRALFRRFPLDVFLLDDPSRLGRMREDESALELLETTQSRTTVKSVVTVRPEDSFYSLHISDM
jgi:predicted nucleotidyltransferase